MRCSSSVHTEIVASDTLMTTYTDIAVELTDRVALVEIRRPPDNFFDVSLIEQLGTAFEALDRDADCRAIVLASQGKSFCAGANFTRPADTSQPREQGSGLNVKSLYVEAL